MIYFYRLVSFVIDTCISIGIIWVLSYVWLLFEIYSEVSIFVFILIFFTPLIFNTILIKATNGQSLGKKIFGLKIVDQNTSDLPNTFKIVIREIAKLTNLTGIIFLISVFMILNKPENNQTAADWAFGTKVIWKNQPELLGSNKTVEINQEVKFEKIDQEEFEQYLQTGISDDSKPAVSKGVHWAWQIYLALVFLRSGTMSILGLIVFITISIPQQNFNLAIWQFLLLTTHFAYSMGYIGFMKKKAWGWWIINNVFIQNLIFLFFRILFIPSPDNPVEFLGINFSAALFMIFLIYKFNSPILRGKFGVKQIDVKQYILNVLIALFYILIVSYYLIFRF